MKYICRMCGYVFYNENNEPDYEEIIEAEELPDDFECPMCGAKKTLFDKEEEPEP